MTSYPDYGVKTAATEVANSFGNEIKGRIVVIVGVSPESIGSAMAFAIASQQPKTLVLASRTLSNMQVVADDISLKHPSVRLITVLIDLASQESIRAAASEMKDSVERIDILINNAAVMTPKRDWTQERIELQFGVNHVGPFLLTNLVMEKLIQAAKESSQPGSTRVVNVSSLGHRLSPVRFHDYNFEGNSIPADEQPPPHVADKHKETVDGYPGLLAYGQSKSANMLFAVAITERLQAKGIIAFSVHPGSIWTNLSRNLDEEGVATIKKTAPGGIWKSLDQGAATALVAGFDPALKNHGGGYLSDCQLAPDQAMGYATDGNNAERLWALSEELVKQKFQYSV